MKRSLLQSTLALLAASALPGAAVAHHSFAMYDIARLVTIKGAVTKFQWANPHSLLLVFGAPVGGGAAPAGWTIEMTSPGALARFGWSRTALQPGDAIEAQIAPLRAGGNGGALISVKILSTGRVLSARPPEYKPAGPS